MSQIFGNHWIEELAAGHLCCGDESGDSGAAPRRDDLDVEPRLRPLLAIGRSLVQPHHVGQRLVVEPIEPIVDVDQQRRQRVATVVAERRQIRAPARWVPESTRSGTSMLRERTPSNPPQLPGDSRWRRSDRRSRPPASSRRSAATPVVVARGRMRRSAREDARWSRRPVGRGSRTPARSRRRRAGRAPWFARPTGR